ncbi:MAG: RNA chaperone Hfq [Armatimonadota bacterium]
MSKGQINLQDVFLNQVRRDRILVTIYLTSGVQLKGIVKGFDSFTILLETPGKPTQIVYKHAVASIVPAVQIDFTINDNKEEQVEQNHE